MKAFLSHSSKDKSFVRQVAGLLGESQVEYDELTFEHGLNVQNIRNALTRCDLFVYFLSANSISSSFVDEEQRTALEMKGKGIISRTLIMSLDETSYRQLPDWLREINVVQRLSSPKACARKIQAALVQLEAEADSQGELYVGRESEDALLRSALSGAPSKTPKALHAVGLYGVGRKTFLRKNLSALFPRRMETFIDLSLSSDQGIEDFYRQLYGLVRVSSLADTIRDFEEFSEKKPEEQISLAADLITEIQAGDEFLIITDDGGVYTEEGNYQAYMADIISSIATSGLPVLGFVQTRMMPAKMKAINPRSYHQYLSTLQDNVAKDLLGLTLKQLEVDYSDEQLKLASAYLDGHPFNVRFAATYAHDYGIESLIADPSELVDWKRRRAEDFLRTLDFNDTEGDILAAVADYRYLATEMIFAVVAGEIGEVARSLRRLQEFSCVEQREGYCHIAPPLRDAMRRDSRFERSESWKRALGQKVSKAMLDYVDEDRIRVSILDTAAIAAAKGGVSSGLISHLILPSHLLRIARDYYDRGRRGECITFCERAWESRTRLPYEAQMEVLRLWGLSAVRTGNEQTYTDVINYLTGYTGKAADRIRLFLEGFNHRVNRRPDEAEKKFTAAWRISRQNQSVNRELANLLCKQRRYAEAETYARDAYEQAPTNPYIIDVMAETLLGKRQQGLPIDQAELGKVMADLERYGDAPGSSFFLVRQAQGELARRDYKAALKTSNRAVERTPSLSSAYFIRAEALLALNDATGAEQDAKSIERILTQAGGFSEGDEAKLHELEIKVLIEKRLFRTAKERTDKSAWLARKVAERLKDLIARGVLLDPQSSDQNLRSWAEKRFKPSGKR